MGRTTLNIEKDTALISHSQKQSLFSLNQVETDTRIALHCSESSKPVLVKAKDKDILILMVYVLTLVSFSYLLRYRQPILWNIKNMNFPTIAEGYICCTSH